MRATFLARLLVLATLSPLAACVPIPPSPIAISEVPAVAAPSCTYTIVRKGQFAGSFPTHYISLDGRTIASLERGQYTTFAVAEGAHSLAVTWRVGDKLEGVAGYGGGVGMMLWSPYSKRVEVDCVPPTRSFFTITAHALPPSFQQLGDETARIDFEAVERLEAEFALDRNKYVAPGPRR